MNKQEQQQQEAIDQQARKEAGSGKALQQAIAEQQADYDKWEEAQQLGIVTKQEKINFWNGIAQLNKAMAKQEEERKANKIQKLMQQVRDNDTDTFTEYEWKTLALAGSIYWQ
jgi:hypothetical protein